MHCKNEDMKGELFRGCGQIILLEVEPIGMMTEGKVVSNKVQQTYGGLR